MNELAPSLVEWIEKTTGGQIAGSRLIAGGNRYSSWAIDVQSGAGAPRNLYLRYEQPRPPGAEPYTLAREAQIYLMLRGQDLRVPRLIAVRDDGSAMLTERASGHADYRRLDTADRQQVALDFINELSKFHRLALGEALRKKFKSTPTIADAVRQELAIWQAMYEESGRPEPLLDFTLDWLRKNIPNPSGQPILVHGDAGPGNFLFDQGRLTALVDWELAHLGDPMEDLAWFMMRATMETVPDVAACVRSYEQRVGAPVDRARILYHRVFVPARVLIIRHRNVTGIPGSSIVSLALNRRLAVQGIAEAAGIALTPVEKLAAEPTEHTYMFDHMIAAMRDGVASRSSDPQILLAAKDAARTLKFLRNHDMLGERAENAEIAALTKLLGRRPTSSRQGQSELVTATMAGKISVADTLDFFAGFAAHYGQIAAATSGGLASRTYPPF